MLVPRPQKDNVGLGAQGGVLGLACKPPDLKGVGPPLPSSPGKEGCALAQFCPLGSAWCPVLPAQDTGASYESEGQMDVSVSQGPGEMKPSLLMAPGWTSAAVFSKSPRRQAGLHLQFSGNDPLKITLTKMSLRDLYD